MPPPPPPPPLQLRPLNIQRQENNQNGDPRHPIHPVPPPPPWSTSVVPPWSTLTRPLSDIRELTEPSLVEIVPRKPVPDSSLAHKTSLSRKGSLARGPSVRIVQPSEDEDDHRGRKSPDHSPGSEAEDRASIYNIPPGSVPPRSSSKPRRERSVSRTRNPSAAPPPLPLDPPPRGMGYTIPNRGQSRSPVKEVAARLNPVESDFARRIPSRTFVRTSTPTDILEFPIHRHPRISLDIQLGASLFVGGGSIEGRVRIVIDDAERVRHKRALAIARISVDLLGVEELSSAKRSVFLNLATELIDSENPPPHRMVESTSQISPIDPFWHLVPSSTSLPFALSLPLDVGPPPFQSKHARIRYVICATLLIRSHGKQYLVRTTQELSVLSVYDPEKALMSLPSPLTASDEYHRPRETGVETIKVTAGLHRQVWVSGTTIFVDIHVANHSRKTVRKIELQLERDILFYKHAAASTMEKSASQARIFDSNERSMLVRNTIKAGTTHCWNGVAAHSSELRTCDLELPRGHATVKCGKYFEVRYFLNILVSSAHTKLVTIQLPIVLIHMNSLDVVPNSVAQVAAAIEEKRAAHIHAQTHHLDDDPHLSTSKANPLPRPPPSHPTCALDRRPSLSVQGRAFAAPRKQSLDRMRAAQDDLQQLASALQSSPRKFYSPSKLQQQKENAPHPHLHRENSNHPSVPHQIRRVQSSYDYRTPPSNRKGRLLEGESVEDFKARLRRLGSTASNRTHASNRTNLTNKSGIKNLTRGASLRSRASRRPGFASALGFREAEVEEDVDVDVGRGGGGRLARPESAASFKSKLEQARNRQWEFQLSRKRSGGERWKGVGWLRGREADERRREGGWL